MTEMERETRIELATNSLEGCDSTIELLPQSLLALLLPDPGARPSTIPAWSPLAGAMVAREGFEPSKALGRQIYSLLRLTASLPRRSSRESATEHAPPLSTRPMTCQGLPLCEFLSLRLPADPSIGRTRGAGEGI